MGKLPRGTCPKCGHELWDNHADLKGHSLAEVTIVCIYCAEVARYELTEGRYVSVDVDKLDQPFRMFVRGQQLMAVLAGDKIEAEERAERKKRGKVD